MFLPFYIWLRFKLILQGKIAHDGNVWRGLKQVQTQSAELHKGGEKREQKGNNVGNKITQHNQTI